MDRQIVSTALLACILAGCGDGGSGQGNADPNLVGAGATQYSEASEATNSTHTSPEETRYVLDAAGLAISGSFEATAASDDYYLISSGDFSAMDLRVFLDGTRMPETSAVLETSIDAQMDDGYSPTKGNDIASAWVAPNLKYLIHIAPFTVSGKSYVIQLKGH